MSETTVAHKFGVFMGAMMLLVVSFLPMFLWAKVLQDVWGWFIVAFVGLAPLTYWGAVGVLLVRAIIFSGIQRTVRKNVDDEPWWQQGLTDLAISVFGALFIWGLSWLYAGFAS